MTDETPDNPPRRIRDRLLHATAEVLLSLLFGAGVFLASTRVMCHNNHACNGFGGVAFLVAGFLIAAVAWSVFLTFCRRFRNRPDARKKLDIATIVLTVILWAGYLLG